MHIYVVTPVSQFSQITLILTKVSEFQNDLCAVCSITMDLQCTHTRRVCKLMVYSRGEVNLSGKSLSIFSRAISDTGPNSTTGRTKPGCLRTTRSYAGNLLMLSANTTSSQWSCNTQGRDDKLHFAAHVTISITTFIIFGVTATVKFYTIHFVYNPILINVISEM